MAERVDLYRFVENGTGKIWTFTSAPDEQTYNAGDGVENYIPMPLGRTEIQQKQEITKASLDVTLDIENDLAIKLISAYTENVLSLTVFTKYPALTQVAWKGRLAGIQPGDATVKLVFESIFTSLRRAGLRARFQKTCRHALYGRGCNLDPEDFATIATLDDLDGRVLTVPEAALQSNGYYLGGMVRDPSGALAYIVNHVGTSLTLQRVPYTLQQEFAANGAGVALTIYPGCDHTLETCWAKFVNGLNFGGFPWIPAKNPMGGSSIV